MKQNKYDDESFYKAYSQMERSQHGLAAAGEWHVLRSMLPDFDEKRVLDLGCGYGWHCKYAAEQGAARVLGTDISKKMLQRAAEINSHPAVEYRQTAMEDINEADGTYDVVLSSLALHYIADFAAVCRRVHAMLAEGGDFVFSVEHPVFTAEGRQDWFYDANGSILHWPVDRYFTEGQRQASFLGEEVTKYHRTVAGYLGTLLQSGFAITSVAEPEPDPALLQQHPEYAVELRRPMFLLVAAHKQRPNVVG